MTGCSDRARQGIVGEKRKRNLHPNRYQLQEKVAQNKHIMYQSRPTKSPSQLRHSPAPQSKGPHALSNKICLQTRGFQFDHWISSRHGIIPSGEDARQSDSNLVVVLGKNRQKIENHDQKEVKRTYLCIQRINNFPDMLKCTNCSIVCILQVVQSDRRITESIRKRKVGAQISSGSSNTKRHTRPRCGIPWNTLLSIVARIYKNEIVSQYKKRREGKGINCTLPRWLDSLARLAVRRTLSQRQNRARPSAEDFVREEYHTEPRGVSG